MLKNYKTNVTEEILLFLEDVIKAPIKAFFEVPYKCHIPKEKLYPRFNYLEKTGCIKRNKNNFQLTSKGRQKAWYLKWKLKRIDIKKWDGKWRVLSFDIPENKKQLRESLRWKLVSLNFIRLHDSVWITPLPIEKEIDQLVQMLGIKYFVRYMIVERINFDNDLRKKFFK